MKILYVHHNPGKGGSSNSLRMMLESLVKLEDLDILITCPPGPAFDRFEKSGFKVIESPAPYVMQTTAGVPYQWLALIRNFLHKRNHDFYQKIFSSFAPDIIHFNEVGLYSYAKLAKSMGFKTVLHSRIVPDKKYKILTNRVQNRINMYVDHFIAIDNSVINSLKNLKIPKSVVYNPYHISKEVEDYSPSHFEDKTFHVTFLSNFLVHKGIEDVIHAAILLKDDENIKFNIAGANVKSETYYQSLIGRLFDVAGIYPDVEKWISTQIRKHNLSNINLLGEVKDIETLLKKTHVILMPNHMNEPSRSVFEGGVFGIPSIISMDDVVEDVVEDGLNGFIVEEKSPRQIADKILAYKSDREMLSRMGKNARERFLKMNDSETSAKNVLMVYKKTLSQ